MKSPKKCAVKPILSVWQLSKEDRQWVQRFTRARRFLYRAGFVVCRPVPGLQLVVRIRFDDRGEPHLDTLPIELLARKQHADHLDADLLRWKRNKVLATSQPYD